MTSVFLKIFLKIIKKLGKIAFCNSVFTSMIIGYSLVFLWVLSNALWNQQGKHPFPIFITRHLQSKRIMLGLTGTATEELPDKGVTFVIVHDKDNNKLLLKKSPASKQKPSH
ncbi:hypothetical protein HUT03_00060 [Candidatus Liberibacter africanus]|uniref:Uncharacterized protein n=1 Tax=Candidatus Liberibacter africanus PTSAPSY TaxID=1277257 RepID=A0A0G3I1C6_LIBAF|nr:hypothetical protein [Candidatus Liberibacter africanus]AKK19676.1 hypothetical protein G293_00060 [Candidatus Liberibacter africanus PTSAPSY]QTP63564.1 hypothetical protein HUT03_00060 [Candidatus Liberibacter africanus]